jgi:hypothetical protein
LRKARLPKVRCREHERKQWQSGSHRELHQDEKAKTNAVQR